MAERIIQYSIILTKTFHEALKFAFLDVKDCVSEQTALQSPTITTKMSVQQLYLSSHKCFS